MLQPVLQVLQPVLQLLQPLKQLWPQPLNRPQPLKQLLPQPQLGAAQQEVVWQQLVWQTG